jgi:hypothetical protein
MFWCFVISRLRWVAFAPFGGCYIDTVFTVGRKHAMEPGQVYSGLGHQRRQLTDEIQQFKDDVRGPIAVGRFELISDITRRRQ